MGSSSIDVAIVGSLGDSLVTFRGDLLKLLRARGYRVLALAPEISELTRTWLTAHGIEFEEAPLSRTGKSVTDDLRFLWWLRARMRAVAPSAMLAYTVKPVVYGLLATGSPIRRYALITGLGYAFTEGRGDRRALRAIIRQLYRIALRRADLVFFQNPDDEAVFRHNNILARDTRTQIVAGSGVNLEEYAYSPLAGSRTIVFLLIARLLGDKGIREYVEAARQVKRDFGNARFLLVGWIDSNPDAIRQDELDGWIADGSIEFLGRLRDVRPAIQECTVYVLPSYREGTPRTVLEAMAMGRAIITTNAPGCRETVEDHENGFLVPSGSVSALAEAMKRFLIEPGLATTMGARSRAIAERKYDSRKVSAEMLDAMQLHQVP